VCHRDQAHHLPPSMAMGVTGHVHATIKYDGIFSKNTGFAYSHKGTHSERSKVDTMRECM
jgi:hypothetical protein